MGAARRRWVLLASLLGLAFPAVTVHAVDTVSAEYGVAAGRDIRDSTITINQTFKPEELQAAVQGALTPLQTKVEALSRQLGVTDVALVGFFRILKQQQVPLEELPVKLAEIAQRHRAMLERLAVLEPEDPTTKALLDKARAALQNARQEADYEQIDQWLKEAETAELAAVRMAETLARQAQEAADRRRLGAAKILAERGELSMTRLNYREAAQHFKAASEQVPPAEVKTRQAYRERYANALYRQGEEKGDNAALVQAIEVYQALLQESPRARVPLQLAMTQNNLGLALLRLGERETGTARFEEAVAVCQEALKEQTRARAPLDWAMTQDTLGLALAGLGEREGSTARLEEAVRAYGEALEVFRAANATYYVEVVEGKLQQVNRMIQNKRGG